MMKLQKNAFALLFALLMANILSAQSPLYLEIGDCAKVLRYAYSNQNGYTTEYFDYHFVLNEYETVILQVSKNSKTELKSGVMPPKSLIKCGSADFSAQVNFGLTEAVQVGVQEVYLIEAAENGYQMSKVIDATYMLYSEGFLRVIGREYGFNYDSKTLQDPGAELKMTGEGNLIFYAKKDENCYHRPTFMHVPMNFMETSNLDFVFGLGLVHQYGDMFEKRLISVNKMPLTEYLAAFCNGEKQENTPAVAAKTDPEIDMRLVDAASAGLFEGTENTAKGGDAIAAPETTPAENVIKTAPKTVDYSYFFVETPAEVPSIAEAETAKKVTKSHTVIDGETLYSISQKYKVTTLQLKKKNNLKDNSIEIGQILIIE